MKNLNEETNGSSGITLIALVITIIVLLILAGVSLSAVFSQQGIFNRAENAVEKHSKSKAREAIDLILSEAQMKKYEDGLSEDELNKIIEEVGELLPKADPESNNQLVIVDGYIFEIDRSVPKVVEEKGPADGVIITAKVSGNNGWAKPGEGKVSITGTIKTYSGGTITTVSAKNDKNSTLEVSLKEDGSYIIENIKEDTIVTINAEDSNKKKSEKTIEVKVKVDNISPIVDTVTVIAEGTKIKISATGTDNESGLKHFVYNITSTEDTTLAGIPTNKRTGIILVGETEEIISTKYAIYTIAVTAVDNCDNVSQAKTVEVETGILISEAKTNVNASNLKNYIGVKVTDYIPDDSDVSWRVFYYDGANYFGDGYGTLYLKRDYSSYNVWFDYHHTHVPSDGGELMKQMNPLWGKSENANAIDTIPEHCTAYLCDSKEWTQFKTEEAKYAIGGPSVEMYMKAFNTYKGNSTALVCKIGSIYGYSVGADGKYDSTDDAHTSNNSIEEGPRNIFMEPGSDKYWYLASPSVVLGGYRDGMLATRSINKNIDTLRAHAVCHLCPIVALNH